MNLNKTLPPLSVYIHIPWCVHKCPYCDFNSHEIKGSIDEDAYTNHLIQDFKNDAKYIQGREIQTIFIGGGTPNSLKASSIGKILDFIKDNYKVSKDLEVTMEANPGAFNTEYFQEYVDNGVNRISIGVQSFQSNKLAFLERIHSKDDAIKVIKHLKTIKNLKSFNIDLMYGLKDQTLEDMQSDLKTAISLEPDHISWYQLTIEPNTRFFHDVPKNLPDDDYLYELSQSGLSILEEAGYKRYEISAYGKSKDVRCLHNLNYWKFGDYLGIGCGAHGKLTLLDGSIYRTEKLSSPKSYMLGAYELKTLKVQKDEIIFQYFLNKFRLVNNRVYELELLNNTGFSFISIEKQIKSLNRKEFLLYNKEDGYIELTDKGFLFLNDVLEEFLN